MNKVFLRALAKEASTLHLKLLNLDEKFESNMLNMAFEQQTGDAKQAKTLKKYLNTLSEVRIKIDDEMHNVDENFEQQFGENASINEAFGALLSNESNDDINTAFQDIITTYNAPIKVEDQNIISAAAEFIH